MGYVFLISAIFAENAGKVLDKLAFIRTPISATESLRHIFAVMAFVVSFFIVLTRPELPALTVPLVTSLAVVVVLSLASNKLDAVSLKINPLSLREPISNFHPILAGFIGYILFPGERNVYLLVALVLGAVIVAWGIDYKRLKKAQKSGVIFMLSAVFFESILNSAYVFALDQTSPEVVALVRVVSITLVLLFFFKPRKKVRKNRKQAMLLTTLAGLAYGIGAVISLYALQELGIVTTMLLMLLGPALRYLSAYIFLQDKATRKEVVSSVLLGLIAIGVAFV